ncbi:hypothetical protein [Nonomuraea typhae]|uniref:hypothetical protein n=1 Tax=Nonomuraea typhae TaxID=2603600 RepID=UPI0012FC0EDC|nr:hypothetical protein [Nonomuraea typhae]
MAVYRVDQYARTFYGPNPEVPYFPERSFTSYSVGYEGVFLAWDQPSGAYAGFRLVASLDGYPTTETGGTVLIDSPAAPASHLDKDAPNGRFCYYAIFLKINNVWVRSALTSTLHIADYGSVQWMWERIPHHYRLLRGNHLTVDADSNQTLLHFIKILGYGLDRVRTSMEAALESSELRTTHITTAAAIAASIGAYVPEGLAPDQMRALTIDAAYLASERGHPAAMRSLAQAVSGWDVELRKSGNLMPSYDQAEQITPRYPAWDASIRYKVGDLVSTDFHLYRCLVAAYGIDQAPPGNGSNNTWWAVHTAILPNDATNPAWEAARATMHGWSAVSFTGQSQDATSKALPKLVIGVPHPVTDDRDANTLTVTNTSASAADIALHSLPPNPAATYDPLLPITHGIALPRVPRWEAARAYRADDLVTHRGQVYRALRRSTGKQPQESPSDWSLNSTDSRLKLTVSGYIHTPHLASQAAAPCFPYITWFDEQGKQIARVEAKNSPDTRVLDTFTATSGTNAIYLASNQVAVTAGTSYAVQGRFFQTAPFPFDVGVEWYNASGTFLNSTMSSVTVTASTWRSYTAPLTAPATAAKAVLTLYMNVGAHLAPPTTYVDEFYLATAAAPSTPLTADSTFENGFATWYLENAFADITTERAYAGSRSLKLSALGAGNYSLGGRVTEYGNKTWTARSNGFIRDSYANGVARPRADVRCLSTIDYGSKDATIAATFATAPTKASTRQALVLRYLDQNNYLRATRTQLERVQAGVVTVLGTYTRPVTDGDRLSVTVSGDNYSAKINGTAVLAATSAFNNTSTIFGLTVEP